MSDKKSAEQFTLPGASESTELLDQLYTEAFFGKMAEYGYTPQTAEGAQAMLESAYQLDMVDDTPAPAATDPFVDANTKLAHVLARQGKDTGVQQIRQGRALDNIKHAAVSLAQDANLYRAVLSVKAAEAAMAGADSTASDNQ